MSPDPRAVDKLRSWYNHQMEIQIQFESDNMHPNVPAGRCDFPFRFVRQILIEAFNARDQNGGCLRFRCLLRALRHEPLDICEFSSKGRSGELEFYVQLHLEDSTGKGLIDVSFPCPLPDNFHGLCLIHSLQSKHYRA